MTDNQATGVRVLAVDDQRANLLALGAVLSDDHRVTFATSGVEALAILREHPGDFDLVLLDVQMPELDGFETARRIKQLMGCEDLPIAFVSGVYTEGPFVRRGYEVGGIDYFTKPFDSALLKKKVAIYGGVRQAALVLRECEREHAELETLAARARDLTRFLESVSDEQVAGPAATRAFGEAGRLARDLEKRLAQIIRGAHAMPLGATRTAASSGALAR
jgi:CheY-like chemotaxis protein